MTNKPLLWVLGGGAFAFVAVVAYWILALTLANQMKSDLVPPDKVASYVYALIEANRLNYTENVVDKLHKAGLAERRRTLARRKGRPSPRPVSLGVGTPCRSKGSQVLVPTRQRDANLCLEWRDDRF